MKPPFAAKIFRCYWNHHLRLKYSGVIETTICGENIQALLKPPLQPKYSGVIETTMTAKISCSGVIKTTIAAKIFRRYWNHHLQLKYSGVIETTIAAKLFRRQLLKPPCITLNRAGSGGGGSWVPDPSLPPKMYLHLFFLICFVPAFFLFSCMSSILDYNDEQGKPRCGSILILWSVFCFRGK